MLARLTLVALCWALASGCSSKPESAQTKQAEPTAAEPPAISMFRVIDRKGTEVTVKDLSARYTSGGMFQRTDSGPSIRLKKGDIVVELPVARLRRVAFGEDWLRDSISVEFIDGQRDTMTALELGDLVGAISIGGQPTDFKLNVTDVKLIERLASQ